MTLPELSVWAKVNLERDVSLQFGAQACPSKEQEAASGSSKAAGHVAKFVCAVTHPKPLPGQLAVFQRLAPSKFVMIKLDSIEVTNIKQLEITVEHRLHSLQIHHLKLGAWVWHFRNEWERNQFVRHLAKLYFESTGHALKIGGVKKTDLHAEDFANRLFEGAHLRREQALARKQRRQLEKDALREEADLSGDEEEAGLDSQPTRSKSTRKLPIENVSGTKSGSALPSTKSSAAPIAMLRSTSVNSENSRVGSSSNSKSFRNGKQSMSANYDGRDYPDTGPEILVGRDVEPTLGMHVRLSRGGITSTESRGIAGNHLGGITGNHGGITSVPTDVMMISQAGTGAVTAMIIGPRGVDAIEVEWYKSAGQRVNVSLRGNELACENYQVALVPQTAFRDSRVHASAGEIIVGLDIYPFCGMRVRLRRQALEQNPSLLGDAKGKKGTIVWVSPDDKDGDGVAADVVKVQWDASGKCCEHSTGYKGNFNLRYAPDDLGSASKSLEQAGPAEALPTSAQE